MPALESTARLRDLPPKQSDVDRAIDHAIQSMLARQRQDGHWVFELEADATIPAEYVLLTHYLGEPEPARETRIASYLRRTQGPHGGWPLLEGGPFNLSATVKAYFALKVIGDSPDAPHMLRARDAILAHGGAGRSNVFTRYLLALWGVLPWFTVPTLPVEIMRLPHWFPFNPWRISYWSRTVVVPLIVLQFLTPCARNPRKVDIAELFPAGRPRGSRWLRAPHQSRLRFSAFAVLDALLHLFDVVCPRVLRKRALDDAIRFVRERLNGEHGLGAIFPAMANTVMMFDALGVPRDDHEYVMARRSVDRLLVMHSDEAYCQPCVSPVWDTVLASHALLETGNERALDAARRGLVWLKDRQVLDTYGDWAVQRPGVRPGGWAFQYANAYYPDLDDTAAVVMALDRFAREHDSVGTEDFRRAIDRGREWVVGLQSRNGGWGAFDADNTSYYLNHIPFADHGALLDPSTSDVTARCAGMLAQLGDPCDRKALDRALAFLRSEQEDDGSWYGRWGMNYIYGTWSALCALHAAGVDPQAREVRRAVEWLVSIQSSDGGWGEAGDSYELDYQGYRRAPSTASQTAWALLALMAGDETRHPAVERGIAYLTARQDANGFWQEAEYTATGFPRVFFLRYHGYAKYFPLWALARYRNRSAGGAVTTRLGM